MPSGMSCDGVRRENPVEQQHMEVQVQIEGGSKSLSPGDTSSLTARYAYGLCPRGLPPEQGAERDAQHPAGDRGPAGQ